MKKAFGIIIAVHSFFLFIISSAAGNGDSVYWLSLKYYEQGDYFTAITEAMRYQFLFPRGKYHAESILLEGKAYWEGKNPSLALNAMTKCFEMYGDKEAGEKALVYSGKIRLMAGSPYFAHRTYLTYEYLYKNGKYAEDVLADKCFSLAMMGELPESKALIAQYAEKYDRGKYLSSLYELDKLIDNETARSKKSYALAVGGSAIIPGFGHFYAGEWTTGLFSLATTGACFFLAWDGYRDENLLRTILFGVVGLSFYQHSLFSAANNVYRYNSGDNFYRRVMLSYTGTF